MMQAVAKDMADASTTPPDVSGNRGRRLGWVRMGFTSLLLLPSLLMIFVFLGLPLIVIFMQSLQDNVLLQFTPPGIENYKYLLTRPYYFDVLVRTLRLSLLTTVFAIPLGYLAAMALPVLKGRIANMAIMALTFPILAGPLVVILGWMALLPDSGPLFGPLVRAGLIRPPRILGSETAIVISQVQFVLPFAILTLYTALKQIPHDLYEAAASNGAGGLQSFLHVTLPLSLPGVLSTTIIVFSLAASSFIAPHYLGGASDLTLTTLITNFVLGTFNSPLAATSSILLLVMMLAAMFVFVKLFGRFIRP
jgi:putative spermidine/putrescine transport system permease protein